GPRPRGPDSWMPRATSSLPVPVSPRSRTGVSRSATRAMASRRSASASLSPMSSRAAAEGRNGARVWTSASTRPASSRITPRASRSGERRSGAFTGTPSAWTAAPPLSGERTSPPSPSSDSQSGVRLRCRSPSGAPPCPGAPKRGSSRDSAWRAAMGPATSPILRRSGWWRRVIQVCRGAPDARRCTGSSVPSSSSDSPMGPGYGTGQWTVQRSVQSGRARRARSYARGDVPGKGAARGMHLSAAGHLDRKGGQMKAHIGLAAVALAAAVAVAPGEARANASLLKSNVVIVKPQYHEKTRVAFRDLSVALGELARQAKTRELQQLLPALASQYQARATSPGHGTGWVWIPPGGGDHAFVVTNKHVAGQAATVTLEFDNARHPAITGGAVI